MRLIDLETGISPETPGAIRRAARISHGGGNVLSLWVDIPAACADSLSDTGNPWLLAMLPMAASLGEDIELSLPVDALLLENVQGILAIWREWYPELHDVRIHCPVQSYQVLPGTCTAGMRTAAFFSGGVDSYFTIARRMPGNAFGVPAVGKVDDLLTVWGFDVGVHDEAQFRPLADMLAKSAAAMGLSHTVVRTNLRECMDVYKKKWGPLTFGAGLAFIGVLFEKRFGEVVLGSSYPYGGLVPWGSHPMVDVLFSTSSLRVMHDGASATRIGKTGVVARFPAAREALHVCQAEGVKNCSRCEKCYRTMIALDVLGEQHAFANVFDWAAYDRIKITKLYAGGGREQIFYKEMLWVAENTGQADIGKALRTALFRSSMRAPLVQCAEWLMCRPLIWRLGVALRTVLLKNTIGSIYINISHARRELESTS